jgi:HSP20 family protein
MLPVVRRNSWLNTFAGDPLATLRSEMDALFDGFFGNDGSAHSPAWGGMPIALWEDDNGFYLEAELPGVAESDVEVTVHNGNLFIRGERRPPEGRNFLFNNRSYGRFQRVINLPASVNPDEVKAELSNGILTVHLSKTPESKPRRITLQAK